MVTPNHKLFSLLHHNYNFATVWYLIWDPQRSCGPQSENHCMQNHFALCSQFLNVLIMKNKSWTRQLLNRIWLLDGKSTLSHLLSDSHPSTEPPGMPITFLPVPQWLNVILNFSTFLSVLTWRLSCHPYSICCALTWIALFWNIFGNIFRRNITSNFRLNS